jgi:hypothetical protein
LAGILAETIHRNKGVVMGKQLDQFEEFWGGIVDEITNTRVKDRVHPVVFGKWEVWLRDDNETLHYRNVNEALESEHEVTKDQMMIHFIKDRNPEERNRWIDLYCKFKDELVE